MKHSFMQTGDSGVITLRGDLTVKTACDLKEALAEALAAVDRLTLEIEEVEGADLSCLQLFCSAHRTAIRQNKQIVLSAVRSYTFTQLIEDAGYLRRVGCNSSVHSECFWVKGGN